MFYHDRFARTTSRLTTMKKYFLPSLFLIPHIVFACGGVTRVDYAVLLRESFSSSLLPATVLFSLIFFCVVF